MDDDCIECGEDGRTGAALLHRRSPEPVPDQRPMLRGVFAPVEMTPARLATLERLTKEAELNAGR